MNYTCTEGEEKVPNDELECKICYRKFTVHSRKPKILDCLHRICARCLTKILHIRDGPLCVSCPFCRRETELHEDKVEGLPNDTNIMSKLIVKDKTSWNSDCKEVVLTPKNLVSSSFSRGSSNCLVITIMEVQTDSPRVPSQSTASDYHADHGTESVSLSSRSWLDQDLFSKLCKHVPSTLVWLLGFLYFGSLPLGIYLLVIQKVTLGVVCMSFVPSSLTVRLLYSFCQCLCNGICDYSSQS
ncbi:E3 ubiquitin-protein ligase RNF182-like isoform X2 [Grus americana]|nr:E3 ubiquitin-protein ligase RNF182-like isoform X2 [Grus americana]XP_054696590.1 E3 ubiquitin-protein ligase RNF182-like isoform X2 [Grus americana]XP_054696591.1 E3 ubiquitin-protein ligase RNF182-like isoform X2 [Grus americana]